MYVRKEILPKGEEFKYIGVGTFLGAGGGSSGSSLWTDVAKRAEAELPSERAWLGARPWQKRSARLQRFYCTQLLDCPSFWSRHLWHSSPQFQRGVPPSTFPPLELLASRRAGVQVGAATIIGAVGTMEGSWSHAEAVWAWAHACPRVLLRRTTETMVISESPGVEELRLDTPACWMEGWEAQVGKWRPQVEEGDYSDWPSSLPFRRRLVLTPFATSPSTPQSWSPTAGFP